MEIAGNEGSGDGKDPRKTNLFQIFYENIRKKLGLVCKTIVKVGRDDPRRITHALKAGFCLTLVSLLYLLEQLFAGIGKNAIWAVMTVVVVLEFTAGATLYKGLNRGFGTLCAGVFAFLLDYVSNECGRKLQASLIGITVFLIGFVGTYMRFIPYIKKNYDYGVVIFVLTFNLITVSSYRVDDVLKLSQDRFYSIAIGCGICLLMSLVFFPNWSGEDLHNSTASKLEGLAGSIEACAEQYFQYQEIIDEEEDEESDDDPIYKGYRAILESRTIDETLALHASWEPRLSTNCCRYPWQQYVELGGVLRHFAYTTIALHGCLQSEIQTPGPVRALFKDPCLRVAREVSKAFVELANSIRNRRRCSPGILSDNLQHALQDLNNAIKSQNRIFLNTNNDHATGVLHDHHKESENRFLSSPLSKKRPEKKVLRHTVSKITGIGLEFSEALPFAAFASLLVEMTVRLEIVIEKVEELGRMANFKEFKPEDVEMKMSRQRSRKPNTEDIERNQLSFVG